VTFLWTTSDAAVATVDENGLVTGLVSGTASVTATAFGGAAATATVTVNLTQKPPVAVIDSPRPDTTLTLGETVNFQGTATDVDGTIASHSWDFGDGTGASAEDPGAHTYTKVGSFRVTYRVTDNDGASSPSATVVVTVVLNQSPTATITSPTNGAGFVPGATIAFTGSGTDHEDGTLTGTALVWTSSRDGQIGTGASFTRNNLSVGTHNITLTATDRGGATGTAAVTITVSVLAPIVPGAWHGSTTGMSLDFTVNSSADGITELKYTFSGLQCGGVTHMSGSVTISWGSPRPISNRQFLITPSGEPHIDIAGTFGDDGTTVSGTWRWLTCSGAWTGSVSTRNTLEPQIP
jgi:PKD repeat protein